MTAGIHRRDLGGCAVVVVNYRSHALVEDNLTDLSDQVSGVRFVVVDCYSGDDERDALRAVCERRSWTFVGLGHNGGFGAGANAGARDALDAGCRALLFVNPDARLDVGVLAALVAEVDDRPDRMVSPVVLRPDGSVWFEGAVTDRRTGRPGRRPAAGDEIPWLSGACLAVSAPLWERLGGFDEDYFMYWEDVDLSYRCAETQGDLAVIDHVSVVHDVGGTQEGGKSPLYVRYCCRNRLLFAAKHLSRRDLLRWTLHTPGSSWLIARRAARRRELIRSFALLRAMTVGSLAGLAYAVAGLLTPRRR